MPNAVDVDARRQRIVGTRNPGSELTAAALLYADLWYRAARCDLQKAAAHGFALVVNDAADADVEVADLIAVSDGHRHRALGGSFLQRLELRFEFLQV